MTEPAHNIDALQAARRWASGHGHPQPDDRMLVAYGRVLLAEHANRPQNDELPALVFNAISRALQDVWPISVPLPVVRERCTAAVLQALDATWRPARPGDTPGELTPEHGPAQPVDATRYTPADLPAQHAANATPTEQAVSSTIAVPGRFARAVRAAHGQNDARDWVRLYTGSGRQYEGHRSASCPGDGVAGHEHDVRCVDQAEG